ncbi:hypothetical protein AGMMS49921_03830 [Endomicrobiia bacterium]|nr:hypothetical protein AGMMS49921_03830 [Endomicrobiia bacterium]
MKQFVSSYGQKAKTDTIDAKMLTVYGSKVQETLRLHQRPKQSVKRAYKPSRRPLKRCLQKEQS